MDAATWALILEGKLWLIPDEDGTWWAGREEYESHTGMYFDTEQGIIDGHVTGATGATPREAVERAIEVLRAERAKLEAWRAERAAKS